MTERGFIAFARGVLAHPIVGARQPYSHLEAWSWLLFEAAWKSRRCAAGSVIVELERGQLVHSLRYMAKAWGWPETNVRRFLARLKADAMIRAETDAGITILTICNYEIYQTRHKKSGADNGAPSGAKTAHHRRRKEQGNKETKENTRLRASWPAGIKDGQKVEVPERDPKTFTEEEWRKRLTTFENTGHWPEPYWGPSPGAPGCLVPERLLALPRRRERDILEATR